MIIYHVNLDDSKQHIINVRLTIDRAFNKGQEFWLPTWVPGSYMIRDFVRNIIQVEAKSSGQQIKFNKIASSRWVIEKAVKNLELQYSIYAWDLSVRSAHFDQQHCFFNGTSVFIAVQGLENESHCVELIAPQDPLLNNWKVATSMRQQNTDGSGFGRYISRNYEELIDHPFEIADTIEAVFNILETTHRMVFTEAPEAIDLTRIVEDVSKICRFECAFFGDEKPPFDNYLFMIFVQKNGYGGLEHRASTALHASYADLPLLGENPEIKSRDYQRFLSLCCHEYFHSWNVKRIKPTKFEPYQLQQEVNTELLWFFEGITSYYDELFLVRSGVISAEDYLDMMAKNITRYMKGKGRLKQSITQSSFDAWTKFYKQDENAPNSIVSYYVKGGLVAFCFDFEIRKLTENKYNLDHLMKALWIGYGKTSKGVDEKDIQKVAEQLVGESMQAFFDHILYSTEDLSLKDLLGQLGVEYYLHSAINQSEKGGFTEKIKVTDAVSSLGIIHKPSTGCVEVLSVLDNGSASMAGLSNKDLIIAINGIRISSAEIDQQIAKYPINTRIEVSYFRRDRLCNLSCKLVEGEKYVCQLTFKTQKRNQLFLNWTSKKQS